MSHTGIISKFVMHWFPMENAIELESCKHINLVPFISLEDKTFGGSFSGFENLMTSHARILL